jgi:hypothetical protein
LEPIEQSGLCFANKIARIYLEAMEEVLGKNRLVDAFRVAGLTELIDRYPPSNLDKEFDFAGYAALNAALDEIYGPRGGRGLALRSGQAAFDHGLKNFGALAGAGHPAYRMLPLETKLSMGLAALARVFNHFSDQHTTVDDVGDAHIYNIHQCAVCWGRTADRPICFAAVGVLQNGLRWLSGGREFRVEQTLCKAAGDDKCSFHIQKEPLS